MPGDPRQGPPRYADRSDGIDSAFGHPRSLLPETEKEPHNQQTQGAHSPRGVPMRARLAAAPAVLAAITLMTSACTTQSGSAAQSGSATPPASVTVTRHHTHDVTPGTSCSPPASRVH